MQQHKIKILLWTDAKVHNKQKEVLHLIFQIPTNLNVRVIRVKMEARVSS